MEKPTISITEYLTRKGTLFQEKNGELMAKCIFSECDKDSRQNEAHLYFNADTSQYQCKKCGTEGNLFTLAEHFGDSKEELFVQSSRGHPKASTSSKELTEATVKKCAVAMPEKIRGYLEGRGIPDRILERYQIGYGKYYGKNWITIPVRNQHGEIRCFKLRQDPFDTTNANRYMHFPSGSKASLFGADQLHINTKKLVICEGELDRLLLEGKGIPAVTSTAGAGTFKDDWLGLLEGVREIYVCFDKDPPGDEGAKKVIEHISKIFPEKRIWQIRLPEEFEGKDITDYFLACDPTNEEFFSLAVYAGGKAPIDTSQFRELSSQDVIDVLGRTIKFDDENKLATFLCMLSAYTEDSQFNISFNAPSSTGKSYIPLEVAKLFPKEDLVEIGYCSTMAFYHDAGAYIEDKKGYEVDLSRKIIVFLDQPNPNLLERLRPILSHDKKEMHSKITDKSHKGGLKTKNVYIKGFASVVFCSAGLTIDEQEGTRFLLLSPNASQEKLRESIMEKIRKEKDAEAYSRELEDDPERLMLKERIEAVRDEHVIEVRIKNPELIQERFLQSRKVLKPRHQRDIGRFISLVKVFALLNLWFREREGKSVIANDHDVEAAFSLWESISESQEYNLPPYIYQLYWDVIVPTYLRKNTEEVIRHIGLTRQEIIKEHTSVYGRAIADWNLRQQILPMLENSGLITQEHGVADKRIVFIIPCILSRDAS